MRMTGHDWRSLDSEIQFEVENKMLYFIEASIKKGLVYQTESQSSLLKSWSN